MRYFTGRVGLLAVVFATLPASAEQISCPGDGIAIHGPSAAELDDACKAVTLAANFLRAAGLSMPHSGSIRLVGDQDELHLAPHELGTYDASDNTIKVLAYDAAVKATQGRAAGLGQVTTRTQWHSYIVHELAHAAVHSGCDKTCPSRAVHECAAAVAQIASLPEQQIDELLMASKDIDAYGNMSEVSDVYYEISPHRFAVKCYKHYRQQADPMGYFRRMLNLPE